MNNNTQLTVASVIIAGGLDPTNKTDRLREEDYYRNKLISK